VATAVQKALVLLGPSNVPAGTVVLSSRQVVSASWRGAVQEYFMFGPVGPSKKDRCRSPQRPSNASHGYWRR
jgi:hypothetical protein